MSAESQMLADLKAFEQTLAATSYAPTAVITSGDDVVEGVAAVAAGVALPVVGSLAVAAVFEGIKLLSGRNFQSDNYYGALLYSWAVLGNTSITSINNIPDSLVTTALEFFELKTGVFISGREHLYALQVSASEYMSYYGVNSYTTQDLVRVQLAVKVVQTYFKGQGLSMAAGSWSKVVGVYDQAATAAVVASRVNNSTDESDTTGTLPGDTVTTGQSIASGVSMVWTNLTSAMKIAVVGFFVVTGYFLYRVLFGKSK